VDIQLYLRVLWRFRLLVASGLLLAVALAFFSYAKPSFDGGKPTFTYRQSQQWESLATLGVGSRSFDPGSVLTPETRGILEGPAAGEEETPRLSQIDPSELTSLPRLNEITVQLMKLATSDEVMRIMRSDGHGQIEGLLQTFEVEAGGSLVPYITFSAVGTSPEKALSLARRHVAAFTKFVQARQKAAGIPDAERVVVYAVNEPQPPTLLEGRTKTRPIIVFLTVMTAVLGLCFVLENLRPRIRPVAPSGQSDDLEEQQRRRSA
jgi:hypothetical protein